MSAAFSTTDLTSSNI